MKEAIVHPDASVTIQDAVVPTPGPDQVLVRVVVFGTNPKDWKVPLWMSVDQNSGDDVAGVVEAVGDGVYEFKKGDRVAGFHVMMSPGGAFAEFALVPSHTTFHVPANISFEEAATLPLAGLTAAFALFHDLRLPTPWQRNDEQPSNTPLVVYGASTAIGAFAIKFANAANIHPIIAVGSSTSEIIREYLDPAKGDALVDYTAHKTPESLVDALKQQIAESSDGGRAFHAFDAVTSPGTYNDVLSKALAGPPRGNQKPLITTVLPGAKVDKVDPSVDVVKTSVGRVHQAFAGKAFGTIWSRLFGTGLQDGWLKPHPHEVIPKGLGGLEGALKALKNGEVRAKKLVGRIAETPGL